MKRFKEGFHIIVRDNDKQEFHVSRNRVYSDLFVTNCVVDAQKKGRNVICSTDESDRETIIDNYKNMYPDFTLSNVELV